MSKRPPKPSNVTSTPRLHFDSVNTSAEAVNSNAPADEPIVESPSLSSSNALARFEFEPGRSKDGTKVLMVEWEDDETTKHISGDWTVSWEGKRHVLPARDLAENGGIKRLYFLLPAGERVPGTVVLTLTSAASMAQTHQREETRGDKSRSKGGSDQTIVWKTNPLPAIFPPELGASALEAGRRGVLHTIWAKKRLQVLAAEIEAEGKRNAEGIALQMAIVEREWIESNFGVVSKPASIMTPTARQNPMSARGLNSPTSPRSPGGSRLMEKLKGLKLSTAPQDMSTTAFQSDDDPQQPPPPSSHQQFASNPLSPEQSDVAISSFGSFAALKGIPPRNTLAAKPAQPPQHQQQSRQQAGPSARKIAAQRPPDSVLAQQQRHAGAMAGSLNAAFAAPTPHHTSQQQQPNPPKSITDSDKGGAGSRADNEDDLFALPMSPRSPDMGKSPFSFGREDTAHYLKSERA